MRIGDRSTSIGRISNRESGRFRRIAKMHWYEQARATRRRGRRRCDEMRADRANQKDRPGHGNRVADIARDVDGFGGVPPVTTWTSRRRACAIARCELTAFTARAPPTSVATNNPTPTGASTCDACRARSCPSSPPRRSAAGRCPRPQIVARRPLLRQDYAPHREARSARGRAAAIRGGPAIRLRSSAVAIVVGRSTSSPRSPHASSIRAAITRVAKLVRAVQRRAASAA